MQMCQQKRVFKLNDVRECNKYLTSLTSSHIYGNNKYRPSRFKIDIDIPERQSISHSLIRYKLAM